MKCFRAALVGTLVCGLGAVAPLVTSSAPAVSSAGQRMGGPFIPTPGRTPRLSGTVDTGTLVGSRNWSGYAETGTGFTAVKTTYRVPAVVTGSGTQLSSDWAGIGGSGGASDLVQAGTEADNNNGVASYYAWTEILPAAAVRLAIVIHPGDLIKVKVREISPNVWSMKVVDVTTGGKGGRTVNYVSGHGSAEVIHERPSICNPTCGAANLAQTSNPVFDPSSYSATPAGSAPGFVKLLLPELIGTLDEVAMVNDADTAVIATPSDADTDIDGFQVADGSVIPPPPPS